MRRFKLRLFILLTILAAVLPSSLSATTVLQMNLEQMVDRAEKIFRGTVMDIREGTVQVGGGELPVVTYRIRVDESFKGTFQTVKGLQVAEIKMLGKLKVQAGSPVRAGSILPELPRLQVGQDYLLLTTAPSSVGLSTTIGLGQGRFELQGKPGQEQALNGNRNLGLFYGMESTAKSAAQPEGPVSYSALANLIRDIVSQ
jgi:hypothetical protein